MYVNIVWPVAIAAAVATNVVTLTKYKTTTICPITQTITTGGLYENLVPFTDIG